MNLVDIDSLRYIEGLVYYIKEFEARAIILDDQQVLQHIPFCFSVEYHPLGDIFAKIKTQNDMLEAIKPQLVEKINKMDQNGDFYL